MLYYIFGGFIFGLLMPYMARRFAKFMPATPAYALWQLIHPGKRIAGARRRPLLKAYFWRSLMSGLLTAVLTYVFVYKFGFAHSGWYVFYLWVLLLLAEIDSRMHLLPDILTVPLLIAGFAAAALGAGFVIAPESALGALTGYLLPVVVSLLLVWRNKDAFGGGDIKLLAAIGAWLGIEPLLYVIAVASILTLVYTLLRRQRSAAFGPGLAVAAIIVAFCFF